MNIHATRLRLLGLVPILCGLFVIGDLAATESVSSWIFPTGIVAMLLICSGCCLLFRRRAAS